MLLVFQLLLQACQLLSLVLQLLPLVLQLLLLVFQLLLQACQLLFMVPQRLPLVLQLLLLVFQLLLQACQLLSLVCQPYAHRFAQFFTLSRAVAVHDTQMNLPTELYVIVVATEIDDTDAMHNVFVFSNSELRWQFFVLLDNLHLDYKIKRPRE